MWIFPFHSLHFLKIEENFTFFGLLFGIYTIVEATFDSFSLVPFELCLSREIRKMPNKISCILVIILILKPAYSADFISDNEVLDYDHNREPDLYGIKNNSFPHQSSPNISWLSSAKNALSGPAGRIAVSVVREMIARSTGNSQVTIKILFVELMDLIGVRSIIVNDALMWIAGS